jgi:hypothetical protein
LSIYFMPLCLFSLKSEISGNLSPTGTKTAARRQTRDSFPKDDSFRRLAFLALEPETKLWLSATAPKANQRTYFLLQTTMNTMQDSFIKKS